MRANACIYGCVWLYIPMYAPFWCPRYMRPIPIAVTPRRLVHATASYSAEPPNFHAEVCSANLAT